MFVNVEPAEFFMYRVKLIFDLESPDSEDAEAKEYLLQHELEPRYLFDDELEGRKVQVMQFGGCYLGGKHLDQLAQIQRSAVEVEVLTEEIERHLNAFEIEGKSLTSQAVESTVQALVPQFHSESAFQTGENSELVAVLDGEAVIEAARRLIHDNGAQGIGPGAASS